MSTSRKPGLPQLYAECVFGNESCIELPTTNSHAAQTQFSQRNGFAGSQLTLPEIQAPQTDQESRTNASCRFVHRDNSVPPTDPLEKYKQKVNAKNWSDFANRIINKTRLKKKQSNEKMSVLEKVVFRSNKGTALDVSRVKRPLSSKRKSVDEACERVKIELHNPPNTDVKAIPKRKKREASVPRFSGKERGKLNVPLEQVELLESIGMLVKYKDSYYPRSMVEVEYFVKQLFGSLYDLHYNGGTIFPSVDDLIPQDVKDFGLAAYRNNLHLSEREECVVLIDWLKNMKQKCGTGSGEASTRNLQLLLSFCLGEAVRMSKIECSERGLLIQLIWQQAIGLMKGVEEKMIVSKEQLKKTVMQKNKEFEGMQAKEFGDMKKRVAELSELVENLKKELAQKDSDMAKLAVTNDELKERCRTLSMILDHVAARNGDDSEKRSNKQKRLILSKLQREHGRNPYLKNFNTKIPPVTLLSPPLDPCPADVDTNLVANKTEEPVCEKIAAIPEDSKLQKAGSASSPRKEPPKRKQKVHLEQKSTQTNAVITIDQAVDACSDDEDEETPSESEFSVSDTSRDESVSSGKPEKKAEAIQNSKTVPETKKTEKVEYKIVEPKSDEKETNSVCADSEKMADESYTEEEKEGTKDFLNVPAAKVIKQSKRSSKKSVAGNDYKGTRKVKAKVMDTPKIVEKSKTMDKPANDSSKHEKEVSNRTITEEGKQSKQMIDVKQKDEPINISIEKDVSSKKEDPPKEERILSNLPKGEKVKKTKGHHSKKTKEKPTPSPEKEEERSSLTESPTTIINAHIAKILPELMTLINRLLGSQLPEPEINRVYQLIVKCFTGTKVDNVEEIRQPYSNDELILNNKKKDNSSDNPSNSLLNLRQYPATISTSSADQLITRSRAKSANKELDNSRMISNIMGPEKVQEESPPDHETVKLEDPETQLPKKLMAAMNNMSDNISQLETDEYGEWLLDITKDNELVRRIINNGHLLTLLLRYLYKKKDETKKDQELRLFDAGTQTETVFTAESLQKAMGESGKMWKDRSVQTEALEPAYPIPRRMSTPSSPHSKDTLSALPGQARKPTKAQAKKQPVTVAQPFNLGRVFNNENLVKTHPAQYFIPMFLEGLERRDANYTNVAPLPMRILLRQINLIYGEKLAQIASSHVSVNQCLALFVYDSFVNKYGLLNVAEQKLKELLLTAVLQRSKQPKVELFARFLGVSEVHYTADDLQFLLSVVLKLWQRLTNVSHRRRDAAIFDTIRAAKVGEAIEVANECIPTKMGEDFRLAAKLATVPRTGTDLSSEPLNVEEWCKMLVETYRGVKKEVQEKLVETGTARGGVGYENDYYDCAGYMKIVEKLEIGNAKEAGEVFEKYAVFVKDDKQNEEIVKKICLENVISLIVKAGVGVTQISAKN